MANVGLLKYIKIRFKIEANKYFSGRSTAKSSRFTSNSHRPFNNSSNYSNINVNGRTIKQDHKFVINGKTLKPGTPEYEHAKRTFIAGMHTFSAGMEQFDKTMEQFGQTMGDTFKGKGL